MNVVYNGERTRIRPFRDMAEWLSVQSGIDSNFNEFWGVWHESEQQQRRDFEECGMLSDSYSCFAIERLDTGECIGFEEYGRILLTNPSTWLGTIISREHWGRGFGREAKLLNMCYLFENYPISSVWADTTDEHSRAKAGLEACGMRRVGEHRNYLWKQGLVWDSPCYQIMRSDWEQLPIRQIVKRGQVLGSRC